jgi:colanic acid/amylovoran biosynthesis glycosyltransferase
VAKDPVPTTPGADSVSVAQFGKRAVLAYTLARSPGPLRQALAERDVRLLHAHFGPEGVYITPTAKALGVPLVTTLHGFDVSVSKSQLVASRKPSWINYVTWRDDLFQHGAVFVCVSEHVRRRALEWGYPADKLVVLPIGVDVDRIRPTEFVEAPRILHIARLVEKKGTADLITAFAQVRRAVPDAELAIVGQGPLRESLEQLAASLGVAGAVRFLGVRRHEETLELLSRSRLLCAPSVTAPNGDQEGLVTVIMEASAAGKPLVATQHGGMSEAVTEGVNGFLVPEHDPATLADRLIELLRDPYLCEQFGKAGREMTLERFNLRTQTGKLESLYRTLM